MSKLNKLYLALIFIVLIGLVSAETTTTITGRVANSRAEYGNAGVSGATVKVTCDGHTDSDLTVSDGTFGITFQDSCAQGAAFTVEVTTSDGRNGGTSGTINTNSNGELVGVANVVVTAPPANTGSGGGGGGRSSSRSSGGGGSVATYTTTQASQPPIIVVEEENQTIESNNAPITGAATGIFSGPLGIIYIVFIAIIIAAAVIIYVIRSGRKTARIKKMNSKFY